MVVMSGEGAAGPSRMMAYVSLAATNWVVTTAPMRFLISVKS